MATHAGHVAVAEGVAGAIDARTLAVPHAQDTVVTCTRKGVGELRAVDGRCGEVLVDAADEPHVMLRKQLRHAFERHVEAAQRRAAIPAHERGGPESVGPVEPVLVERQAHQRLDAGHDDITAHRRVLVVQRDVYHGFDHTPKAAADRTEDAPLRRPSQHLLLQRGHR